jgi:hypothetical protein
MKEKHRLEVAADIVERAFEDRFEVETAVSGTRMLATSSAEETSVLLP